MKRHRAIAVLLAALSLTVLSVGGPARAAGAMTCQLGGTVSITPSVNLLTAETGSGSFSAGVVTCEGSVSGAAVLSVSGNFAFCRQAGGPHPCGSTTPDEAVFTALQPTQLVTHTYGNIGFTLNTGWVCSFNMQGHAMAAEGVLHLSSYQCSGGGPTFVGDVAVATGGGAPVVNPLDMTCDPGPGGVKACFGLVLFSGQITAIDS
jgi:hypothetical protein